MILLVWPIPAPLIGATDILFNTQGSRSVADNVILVLLVLKLLNPSSTWYPLIGTLSSE